MDFILGIENPTQKSQVKQFLMLDENNSSFKLVKNILEITVSNFQESSKFIKPGEKITANDTLELFIESKVKKPDEYTYLYELINLHKLTDLNKIYEYQTVYLFLKQFSISGNRQFEILDFIKENIDYGI